MFLDKKYTEGSLDSVVFLTDPNFPEVIKDIKSRALHMTYKVNALRLFGSLITVLLLIFWNLLPFVFGKSSTEGLFLSLSVPHLYLYLLVLHCFLGRCSIKLPESLRKNFVDKKIMSCESAGREIESAKIECERSRRLLSYCIVGTWFILLASAFSICIAIKSLI